MGATKPTIFTVQLAEGPIIAASVHSGHALWDRVSELIAVDEQTRLREEDPYTDLLTQAVPSRINFCRSRFEVDLNRPREQAVYMEPKDAWGLKLWKCKPNQAVIKHSLFEYDAFYQTLAALLQNLERQYGCFVVLDLHSYNYRHAGSNAPSQPAAQNPEVNIGTGSMVRERWAHLVERFIRALREFDFLGRHLDVRENVRFRGGNLARWVHTHFPETGCALAVEFKKFFMDEWSGHVDQTQLTRIREMLEHAVPQLTEELAKRGR